MKFLFRKKCKQGKNYVEKLPWVAIQSDLLEVTLGSRGGSRSTSPGPEEGGAGGAWCVRVCLLRLVQFALLLATLATVANFVASALLAAPVPRPRPLLPPVSEDALPHASPATLLDLDDFELLHEAEAACRPARLFFLFLVHSRPDHFLQRQAIRATWGGARDLGEGWATRTVFLLGRGGGGDGNSVAPESSVFDVEGVVAREAARHGDLVVGSFVDHYHNLTYKHVMALRWAARRCSHAIFLVKADDDAFIDVPALRALLGRTFSVPPPRRTLACNALPAGTQPQRSGKWAVSREAYPWVEYPRYCAGLAYLVTPTVADLLARAAQAEVAPRVWVDDVWVTGLLAEALDLRPHYLNLRYSYDHDEVAQWAASARPAAPPPYTFVHLDAARPDWRSTLDTLWSHALTVHTSLVPNATATEPSAAS
ncbi:acetylgalactosaminyl-O-glycosyl-glycoprotein beta-1,3-N-acetylglucosaminyltransferase-like [Portunus trituberculatus]|uniref:acetylgalactosaminyl-O-glycosyl-glycoprotein beta-1,3-N-acetylglucosaminyltransferase-like n=1 Tax=Portunus trituberculatus TaxID=210409 RepID=UPI001E1CFC6E|nr:acetylgalactosaminyl-O-glycosyl-glycoprotein beta-1,3-N-acetylglucosaminyltransferase-like [Portunus trituberculatus]